VLVAAGRGERFGADRPKAFVKLGERVLLAESIERLERSGWVDKIVVVAPPGWEEPAILLAEELGCGKVVVTVAGGATRGRSVQAGVAEVADDAAVVLVHDAARPLVTDEIIERVLAPIGEGWDGAVPGLALPDTVKRVEGGAVIETLDRAKLVGAQTPQAFVASILREALTGNVEAASDCSSLVEAVGGRVRAVAGDPRLLKVTTARDLELVQRWL